MDGKEIDRLRAQGEGSNIEFTNEEGCPWEKLDGSHWASLLGKQPQFAEKCAWEKLDGGNWVDLLVEQPQFADRCPWVKLKSNHWARLLEAQPQFAGKHKAVMTLKKIRILMGLIIVFII